MPPPCSLAEGADTLRAVLATLTAAARRTGWIEVNSHDAAAV